MGGFGDLMVWIDNMEVDGILLDVQGEVRCKATCKAPDCDDCEYWEAISGVADTIADTAREYMEAAAREWVNSHKEGA